VHLRDDIARCRAENPITKLRLLVFTTSLTEEELREESSVSYNGFQSKYELCKYAETIFL
jgi:hypothetical protein